MARFECHDREGTGPVGRLSVVPGWRGSGYGQADCRQGRPIWALRPAGGRWGGEHRIVAGRYRTGRLRFGRGPRAADGKAKNSRRRSEDGDDGVRHDGKIRALRATRRDAGEGEEGYKASEGDEDSEAAEGLSAE